MQRKRSRLDIVYDMLLTIGNKGGRIKPTHLMYKANLSHTQMKLYLDELMAKNLVEEQVRDERKILALTEKGFTLIQKFNQMREFEKTFGL